jgi:hypothetical protein
MKKSFIILSILSTVLFNSIYASAGTTFPSKTARDMTGYFTLISGDSGCAQNLVSKINEGAMDSERIDISSTNEENDHFIGMGFFTYNVSSVNKLHRCEIYYEDELEEDYFDCRKAVPRPGSILAKMNFQFSRTIDGTYSYKFDMIYGDEYKDKLTCKYRKTADYFR